MQGSLFCDRLIDSWWSLLKIIIWVHNYISYYDILYNAVQK